MGSLSLPAKKCIGFVEPGKRLFMDEQATRIETKLDALMQTVHQIVGSQPHQEQKLAQLEAELKTVSREQSKQRGAQELIKWIVPALGLGAGAGAGYLSHFFGG